LLWIAKLDATCLGGGQRLACALADHVPLMLGSGGEHCALALRQQRRRISLLRKWKSASMIELTTPSIIDVRADP
jgi:hypothetical protein